MSINRHFFPGGNTANGFANYFAGIIPDPAQNFRLHVLKGGPGVGKNSFMRACAEAVNKAGYGVEYFHCAGDSESLDAIRVPEIGWTMLDGTAPHIVDPVLPGAADDILNLGTYLDEVQLASSRRKIEALFRENKGHYQTAFGYLKAAGILMEQTARLTRPDPAAVLRLVRKEIVPMMQPTGKQGKIRRLFARAITPQGVADYLGALAADGGVVELQGPKAAAAAFLKQVIALAQWMGQDCEVFDSPLLPGEPECVLLSACKLCITTAQVKKEHRTILLEPARQITGNTADVVAYSEKQAKELIAQAVAALAQAKAVHDEIEKIYTQSMDFNGLNIFVQGFIDTMPII